MDQMEQNLQALRRRLDAAAGGRPYTLLAASKTQPAEVINRLADLGIFDYGENRVQEWMEKHEKIDGRLRYHHIGRLQRNKIKYIIREISLVHSVDQISLAIALNEAAARIGRKVDVLLQVNPAGEEQKGGVSLADLPRLYEACRTMQSLRVRGLMCMAPLTQNEGIVRDAFARTRRAFDEMKSGDAAIGILSMGMSGDAEIALEEGSTLVRIGTALFGKRVLS